MQNNSFPCFVTLAKWTWWCAQPMWLAHCSRKYGHVKKSLWLICVLKDVLKMEKASCGWREKGNVEHNRDASLNCSSIALSDVCITAALSSTLCSHHRSSAQVVEFSMMAHRKVHRSGMQAARASTWMYLVPWSRQLTFCGWSLRSFGREH